MQLNTHRLLLRPLKVSDLHDIHSYRSEPDVAKYQGFYPMDKEVVAAFIADQMSKTFGTPGAWYQLGIERLEDNKLIGDCGIKLHNDPRIAEIGITISHLEQQKGYAKETIIALLNFLFRLQQVHRVTETVDAENTASIKLLESIGFRKEGHFIENIFFKGKWGSECQYAMLEREWRELYLDL